MQPCGWIVVGRGSMKGPTHSNGYSSPILIPKVRSLFPSPTRQVFAVGQQPSRGESNVCIERLYSLVCAFDEEFRVEKTFDSEDDTVRASKSDCDAGVSEGHGLRQRWRVRKG